MAKTVRAGAGRWRALLLVCLVLMVSPAFAQEGDFSMMVPFSLSYRLPVADFQNIGTADALLFLTPGVSIQFLFGISPNSYIGPEVGVSFAAAPLGAEGNTAAGHFPLRLVYHIDLLNAKLDFLAGVQLNLVDIEPGARGFRATRRSPDVTFDFGMRISTYLGLFFDILYTLPSSYDLTRGEWYDGYWDNAMQVGVGYRLEIL